MQTVEYVVYDWNTRQWLKDTKYSRSRGYVSTWTSDIMKAKRWKEPRAFTDENSDLECQTVKVTTSIRIEVDHNAKV